MRKDILSKRERFNKILNREIPDRPPVLAYRHFPGKEREIDDLVESMLNFQKEYDWDIIKVHPTGFYLQEIWGDKYDYSNYQNEIFPTLIHREVKSFDEIDKFVKKPGDFGAFKDEIEIIRKIREKSDDTPILQTVFTPMNILCVGMGVSPIRRHIEAYREENPLFNAIRENPAKVHSALRNIAETLADYCSEILKAGADGFFYAGIGWAREGYMTEQEWEEFVKPYDLIVIDRIKKENGIVMFHTCGMRSNPERFVDYPIDILHWDQGAQNPQLENSDKWLKNIIPMGGVEELQFGNHSEKNIKNQAEQMVIENMDMPFILAPYCSVSIKSSKEELMALRNAVYVETI